MQRVSTGNEGAEIWYPDTEDLEGGRRVINDVTDGSDYDVNPHETGDVEGCDACKEIKAGVVSEDKVWSAQDVVEHLDKVFKHFGLDRSSIVNGMELVALLEAYDAIHPITIDQANTVTSHVIPAMATAIERRRQDAASNN
jgi:hypothetical protein